MPARKSGMSGHADRADARLNHHEPSRKITLSLTLRATRPGEEYRTPTDQEWEAFLSHFERRKLSVGTCARAFNTPC
ncbi:hypothetical protein KGA66_29555, partial [Actinocrinis puniceicyclus]